MQMTRHCRTAARKFAVTQKVLELAYVAYESVLIHSKIPLVIQCNFNHIKIILEN